MRNANFNIKKISNIVLDVRRYGELYVTTDGATYKNQKDAESAVRTKNMIIGEPTEYVGYVHLKKEDLSDNKLKEIAKDINVFNTLFEKAIVPRQRKQEARSGRKFENVTPHKAEDVASVEALLGISAKPAEGAKVEEKA